MERMAWSRPDRQSAHRVPTFPSRDGYGAGTALRIADCGLPIANCRLKSEIGNPKSEMARSGVLALARRTRSVEHWMAVRSPCLRIANCRLPIANCPLKSEIGNRKSEMARSGVLPRFGVRPSGRILFRRRDGLKPALRAAESSTSDAPANRALPERSVEGQARWTCR
jgi:hypothetical protein